MKVSIWDLDYYYSPSKVNVFNPDAMKISSYHKQLGDSINFVTKADDILRPYDLYYIIKENDKTPNAPAQFYLDSKVRWWGRAHKRRINWKMSDVMLACRPDYLLYPEKETTIERAEHLRFLNDKGELLPIKQDWHNSFKSKKVVETDTALWTTSPEITLLVVKQLFNILNLSFFEPIWLPRIASDQSIREEFMKLHFKQRAYINFTPIKKDWFYECAEVWKEIKDKWPHIKIGKLVVKIDVDGHWNNKQKALKDFEELKKMCLFAKENKIDIEVMPLKSRLDTPYFFLFEMISKWTKKKWNASWLEWISMEYGPGLNNAKMRKYWSHPENWSAGFRDLLAQTYQDERFITLRWGSSALSWNDIPWTIWKNEFKLGM